MEQGCPLQAMSGRMSRSGRPGSGLPSSGFGTLYFGDLDWGPAVLVRVGTWGGMRLGTWIYE